MLYSSFSTNISSSPCFCVLSVCLFYSIFRNLGYPLSIFIYFSFSIDISFFTFIYFFFIYISISLSLCTSLFSLYLSLFIFHFIFYFLYLSIFPFLSRFLFRYLSLYIYISLYFFMLPQTCSSQEEGNHREPSREEDEKLGWNTAKNILTVFQLNQDETLLKI